MLRIRFGAQCLAIFVTIFHVFAACPAASSSAYSLQKNIAYLDGAASPALDMYVPKGVDANHRAPGFVWIHGGGWSSGARDGDREVAVCTTLAKAGYVTASIDYVLSGSAHATWPTNLEQCKAAIRFMRRHAGKYGVDTADLAVGGGSAGAHLAVLAAFTGESLFISNDNAGYSGKVKAVLDLYGPVSTREWFGASSEQMLGVRSESDPLVAQSSVETYIRKDSPPVFIAHGLADTVVDARISINFDARLTSAGADHRLVLIPGAQHSFNLQSSGGKPLSVPLDTMVTNWLDARLQPKTSAVFRAPPARAVPFRARDADPGPAPWVTFRLRDVSGRMPAERIEP